MSPSAILTYHSIDASGSVISIAPETFRRHMEILAESHIAVVPLSRIQETTSSVAITFDDGFANFEDHALPVLAEFSFPATVFLVSGHCGGRNEWNTIPLLPLMSWSAIRGLTGGLAEWGAHTVNHLDLTTVSAETAEVEMVQCRAEIEGRTSTPVKTFAYPYGSVNAALRSSASKHFDLACGTRLRYLSPQSDSLELPRLDAYYFRDPSRMKTLMQPRGRFYTGVRRLLRERRSWFYR